MVRGGTRMVTGNGTPPRASVEPSRSEGVRRAAAVRVHRGDEVIRCWPESNKGSGAAPLKSATPSNWLSGFTAAGERGTPTTGTTRLSSGSSWGRAELRRRGRGIGARRNPGHGIRVGGANERAGPPAGNMGGYLVTGRG